MRQIILFKGNGGVTLIKVQLSNIMLKKNMTSKELAKKIGITPANLSILKTGKARGIRFNTLNSICKALNCQPGEILVYSEDEENEQK